MNRFDLFANLEYLNLPLLVAEEPDGWLEAVMVHPQMDFRNLQGYAEYGKYYVTIGTLIICESNTPWKPIKILQTARQRLTEFERMLELDCQNLRDYVPPKDLH